VAEPYYGSENKTNIGFDDDGISGY
jgi:gamma-glutamyl hydrolase